MIEQGSRPHRVFHGVIHCAAVRRDWMDGYPLTAKHAEIKRWHLKRGWRDIGYHWLIDRDGRVMAGRPESQIGAGVKGHNRGVIHVCLIGGHGSTENDKPLDNYTDVQMRELSSLMESIEVRAGKLNWTGHNEHAAKACPGFNVQKWLAERDGRRLAPAINPTTPIATTGGAVAALTASNGYPLIAICAIISMVALLIIVRKKKR